MEVNQANLNQTSTKLPINDRLMDAATIWPQIEAEAEAAIQREPILAHPLRQMVLETSSLAEAMAVRLSRKLHREELPREVMQPLFYEVMQEHPEFVDQMACDIDAIVERDPACASPLEPLLYFKGFHAISTHRLAHALWLDGRKDLAFYLQSVSSEVFATDIHPAARIGCGILLDHATSCVIGETAIIERDVSILHEVTLGGTGKESGDRHPIVRSGVMIGAGAKILGRVEIGTCSKIGSGSVVLADVPPHTTVAGVPAIVVGTSAEDSPAHQMNQMLECQAKKKS